ncbi:type VI secretion system Vgr family protein [Burkholderia anthina]|uniref:type VI secretion system Vgr family protein n=1 Tax=Burkholderia anthina TaxID=179879 RepID=UPI001AA02962|nr:type VI secretion system tip protein TssI/VgrG [Burkholderia anthina]QTD89818.1 type VI secretion system tip protein VgrG [Burkholderia anthina]
MLARPPSSGTLTSRSLFDAFHRGLLQHERLLKLDTPLGANTLVPLRAKGWAKIGRDYQWTVDVASIRDDIALLSLMHQPVTLWIQQTTSLFSDSTYRPVHGFVHRAGILGTDGNLAVYQIEFASALFFLGHTRRDHYWLEKDAREILIDVLHRYSQLRGAIRLNITESPRVRSYCRQADSDLNFVHRLLEDEGWYCYWVHAKPQGGERSTATLVVVDSLSSLPESRAASYCRDDSGNEADGLTQWSSRQTLQSVRYTSRSFDYKRPNHDFELSSELKSTTYEVEHRRQRELRHIPSTPMEIFESTPYGYASSNAGYRRARLRTEAWDSLAERYVGTGGLRWIDAGARFVLNGHPRHLVPTQHDREFVAIEAHWYIENNILIGRLAGPFPRSLQQTGIDAKAMHGARFESRPHPGDGETGFFVVEIEAQSTKVAYRSPFEHAKPAIHIEHAHVVAPEGEEAWTDPLNRIRVRHAWDRQSPSGAFNTSPMLLALQADTGSGYGAVHVPRAGEWVAIGHWGGDCDRPFVLGRLNGGTTPPPWHTNALLSGFQSKGFGKTGAYNALVHDDATNQGSTRVTTFTGQRYSLFHQGYLIRQDGNTRGRYLGMGFVLHTDDYGAVRANRGLYLTTHSKRADSEQLDVTEARDQLMRSGMQLESLSHASSTAQAESLRAGRDAVDAAVQATQHSESGQAAGERTVGGGSGEANGFATPLIVMASPAGIAMTTQQSTQIAADKLINLVSGEHTHIATGKSLIVAAAEKISLFVQKAGMKLFAAKGKVEIEAQSDAMRLYADQDLAITSNRGRIVIEAKQELMLKCGGSYVRITADGIEDGTRGTRTSKAISFARLGPSSVAEHMNARPQTAFNDPYVLRHKITGEVLKNHPYEIVRGDGTVIKGVTDESGQTTVQKNVDVESLLVRVLPLPLHEAE